MKKIITNKLFKAVSILLLLILNGATFAISECTYNSDNQVSDDMSGSGICLEHPTARKVSAYKIGLCTELPYNTNYKAVCDFIFESDTTIDLIAEKGVTSSITGIGDFVLEQDKLYTHSVMLLDNRSALKSTTEFASSQTGRTGTGTYCWSYGTDYETVDSSVRATFNAECGNLSDANPQWNHRTFDRFSSVSDINTAAMTRNFPNWDGGWTNIVMSNESDIATFNNGTPGWDNATNAKYWLAGRGINSGNGITVTSATKAIDLQFKVSWGNTISWNSTGIWNMSPAAFDLTVALK